MKIKQDILDLADELTEMSIGGEIEIVTGDYVKCVGDDLYMINGTGYRRDMMEVVDIIGAKL